MKNKNSKKIPFFAVFIEKKIKDPKIVKVGDITSILKDTITTSALEDGVTLPRNDHVTMKYPSDRDEAADEV